MPDFLDDKRGEINDRLKELRPFVDEFNRLERAIAALAGLGGGATKAAARKVATRRKKPGRPRGSAKPKAAATATATATAPAPARKKPGRPPGKKAGRPAAKRRAGRRKGSGTRAAQALSFVQGQPGITIPELAAKMGIKQNYLYRVLPGLEQENKVVKRGRGWFPKS